jgi:hypothetical protein
VSLTKSNKCATQVHMRIRIRLHRCAITCARLIAVCRRTDP